MLLRCWAPTPHPSPAHATPTPSSSSLLQHKSSQSKTKTHHYQIFTIKNQNPSLSFSYPNPTRPMSSLSISSSTSPHASAQINLQPSTDREDDSSIHGVFETVVGVLGGGQLGRMLCQAASSMGIKVITLDPLENCPVSSVSRRHVIGSFDDGDAIRKFVKRCGVLTVEIEHVDANALEKLEQQGVDCEPKASTIRII